MLTSSAADHDHDDGDEDDDINDNADDDIQSQCLSFCFLPLFWDKNCFGAFLGM